MAIRPKLLKFPGGKLDFILCYAELLLKLRKHPAKIQTGLWMLSCKRSSSRPIT